MPEREAVFIQMLKKNDNTSLYKLNPPIENNGHWMSGFVGEESIEYIVISPCHSPGRMAQSLVHSTISTSNGVIVVQLDAIGSYMSYDHEAILRGMGYTLVDAPKIEQEIVGNPMRVLRLED